MDKEYNEETHTPNGEPRRNPKDGTGEVIFGINDKYRITNHTNGPDELTSMCAFLMANTIDTVHAYSELQAQESGKTALSKNDIRDRILDGLSMYTLTDAGMTPDEAMEVVGIKGTCYEISKEDSE